MVNLKASVRVRLAAAAAVACLAAGVPAVALASSSVPATPRCNASNTYVWFGLSPNGAAGSIYYPVEFTNVSSNACTLTGYPGVSAISKSAHQIGLAATRANSVTVHTVTVKPDQTVHAMLGIVEPGLITACHNAAADGLKVYPPNEKSRKLVLNFTFTACKNKPFLRVYPVTPGIGVP
ncbi:MAG TPA: DUF4232 domain-containing protein [Streptosporangiaceae bacterium]|nr:DUF4232 domain-containing protein [Streptosporangiaceae bacterium]